jgi:hypothetical protein
MRAGQVDPARKAAALMLHGQALQDLMGVQRPAGLQPQVYQAGRRPVSRHRPHQRPP